MPHGTRKLRGNFYRPVEVLLKASKNIFNIVERPSEGNSRAFERPFQGCLKGFQLPLGGL